MRRLTLLVLVLLFCSLSLTGHYVLAEENSLSREERIEDFNYLYQIIAENYPHLWVKERVTGINWLDHKKEFREKVAVADTDREYYQTLVEIIGSLQNGHTHLVSPVYYQQMIDNNLYQEMKPWAEIIYNDEVKERYTYWKKITSSTKETGFDSFKAKYIAGGYWVLISRIEDKLPFGARIIEIEGQSVNTYLKKYLPGRPELYYQDPEHNLLYTDYLPLPEKESVTITYQLLGKIKTVIIPTKVNDQGKREVNRQELTNVITSELQQDKIAYLKVRSFSENNLRLDRAIIQEFYQRVHDYPYLIIDIRGNGGGTDQYWRDLLIAPLISRKIHTTFYITFRSGSYIDKFSDYIFGPGESFMRVGRKSLYPEFQLPDELLTEKYMDPLKIPTVIKPKNTVGFSGNVILLVDNKVYSAAETFAAFSRATGWATLIGGKTGGDGIGITPIFFQLPNSHLLVRMSESMGLNPNGSPNEEFQTSPHIYVETDPQEYLNLWQDYNASEVDLNKPHLKKDQVLRETVGLINRGKIPVLEVEERSFFADFFNNYDGRYGYPIFKDYNQYNGSIIGKISVYGAHHTDHSILKKLAGFEIGERFTPLKLKLAEINLQSFNAHNHVSLDVKSMTDNKVEIIIFAQEGNGFSLSPVELSERAIRDMLTKQLSFKLFNLGGTLTNLEAIYGFTSSQKRQINLETPLPGTRVKTAYSLGSYTNSRQITWGMHTNSKYQEDTQYFSMNGSTYLSPADRLSLLLNYSREKITKLTSESGLNLKDNNYLNLSLQLDKRLKFNSSSFRADLNSGLLINAVEPENQQFGLLTISTENNISLNQGFALYLRNDLGWCDEDTPFNHQFTLGGRGSLSAYSSIYTGNRYLTIGTELRKYLKNNFYLAGIIDGGRVWQTDEQLEFNNLMASLGFAARYNTPVGLGFEVLYAASPVDKDQQAFQFGLIEDF